MNSPMCSSKIWSVIVGAVMAYGVVGVSAPTVSLAQSVQGSITQETNTLNEPSETDTTTGIQTTRRAGQQSPDPPAGADINHRLNELRREFLDDRANGLDRWLNVVALVLTFFGIAIPIAGFLGYRRFQKIEEEALEAVAKAEESANKARDLVKEIEEKRDKADEFLQTMTAEEAANNPATKEQAEAVSKDPNASLLDRAVARAISLQKEGKTEEAIKIWKGIAYTTEEIDHERAASAWFSVGYLLFEQGDYLALQKGSAEGNKSNLEAVISVYDRAIQLKPDFIVAYNCRGIAHAVLGKYQDAITDFTAAIRLKPDYAEAYNIRGFTYYKWGKYQNAITDYGVAVRLKPDYAEAYYNRGVAWDVLDQYQNSIVDYGEAIRLKPDHAVAYNNRGIANGKLGQYQASIVDFNEAIRLKPDHVEAYGNRGIAKAKLGEYEDAIADYDAAIRLKPDYVEAYHNRGIANGKLGRYQVSIADFNETIRLNPGHALAYSNRGIAKAELGEYQDALVDFDESIRLNPDDAEVYYNRGLANAKLGRIAKARADFEKARELAKQAGDEKTVSVAEENLRALDSIQDA